MLPATVSAGSVTVLVAGAAAVKMRAQSAIAAAWDATAFDAAVARQAYQSQRATAGDALTAQPLCIIIHLVILSAVRW